MLQKGLATGILTSALILLGVAGALVASGEAVVGIQPGEPMPQDSQTCRAEKFHFGSIASALLHARGRAFLMKPKFRDRLSRLSHSVLSVRMMVVYGGTCFLP